jgi:hypothetical protein
MRASCLQAGVSLMLLVIWVQQASAQILLQPNKLKPFTTDGCSVWIDGTVAEPYLWRHCCVAHDKAYWVGGTELERTKADKDLLVCVSDVSSKAMGNYMHFFVSAAGGPFMMTPYRWGYGWDFLERGKLRLTSFCRWPRRQLLRMQLRTRCPLSPKRNSRFRLWFYRDANGFVRAMRPVQQVRLEIRARLNRLQVR